MSEPIKRTFKFTEYASRERLGEEYERICGYAEQLHALGSRFVDLYDKEYRSELSLVEKWKGWADGHDTTEPLDIAFFAFRAALTNNAPHLNAQDGRGSTEAGSCETASGTPVTNPGGRAPNYALTVKLPTWLAEGEALLSARGPETLTAWDEWWKRHGSDTLRMALHDYRSGGPYPPTDSTNVSVVMGPCEEKR